MSGGWFETVVEAQRRAKRRLPRSVYSALLAGSERGVSYDDNTKAFGELGFAPHVAACRPSATWRPPSSASRSRCR
ncbi:alpha-hydroxy-acid oxidizing protein [Actinomadura madurae]|uniref:alpha-hydroxy-acid oxidizing protein n=1 Tax=Actinomadura madurae TaxID=1993 RepID=UPI0020D23616|nr:alpha-hydroxy-acid oxidizing protein [Actinomadura madurae]MCP9955230.1 alpha-hydroxy-acid oxidizing protein [Actinomadura madurae]MCP9984467.1 alpha-hydroxy-acid oxidizing protein [Actinomadura madurae]